MKNEVISVGPDPLGLVLSEGETPEFSLSFRVCPSSSVLPCQVRTRGEDGQQRASERAFVRWTPPCCRTNQELLASVTVKAGISASATQSVVLCCGSLSLLRGFPGGLAIRSQPANAGDVGTISDLGRSPGSLGWGNGNARQYSWLENPMDRGVWRAIVHGVPKRRIWLSDRTKAELSKIGISTSSSDAPYVIIHSSSIMECLSYVTRWIKSGGLLKTNGSWIPYRRKWRS